MQFGFSLDPCVILGVGEGASLQEIRDAYRARAKRHHPDHGGDEWVFRVVCQAYELLSQARLAGRLSAEAPAPAAAEAPRVAPIRPPTAGEAGPRAETARHGFRDDVADPSRLVDVEKFVIRYAISDPLQALLATAEDRTLSSSLNLAWPATEAGGAEVSPDPDVLDRVVGAFTPLAQDPRLGIARLDRGRPVPRLASLSRSGPWRGGPGGRPQGVPGRRAGNLAPDPRDAHPPRRRLTDPPGPGPAPRDHRLRPSDRRPPLTGPRGRPRSDRRRGGPGSPGRSRCGWPGSRGGASRSRWRCSGRPPCGRAWS